MSKKRNNTFGHQLTKTKRRKTTKNGVRNWIDLPTDVMLLIFMKLGPVEIILNTQNVCSSWRKLAKEPHLFRTIIVPQQQHQFHCCKYTSSFAKLQAKFVTFFKEAIGRSCGQLVEVWCEDFLNEELLHYLVNKPNSLKSLRIGVGVFLTMNGFYEIIKMLPLLEELHLSQAYFSCEQFEVIGLSCLKLKHLRVEHHCGSWHGPRDYDKHAFVIAKSMPHLHSLQLIRSKMTNKGLQAIQEGYPNLYLDLRNCFKLSLEGDVFKKYVCSYRNIRLSNERTGRWSSTAAAASNKEQDMEKVECLEIPSKKHRHKEKRSDNILNFNTTESRDIEEISKVHDSEGAEGSKIPLTKSKIMSLSMSILIILAKRAYRADHPLE